MPVVESVTRSHNSHISDHHSSHVSGVAALPSLVLNSGSFNQPGLHAAASAGGTAAPSRNHSPLPPSSLPIGSPSVLTQPSAIGSGGGVPAITNAAHLAIVGPFAGASPTAPNAAASAGLPSTPGTDMLPPTEDSQRNHSYRSRPLNDSGHHHHHHQHHHQHQLPMQHTITRMSVVDEVADSASQYNYQQNGSALGVHRGGGGGGGYGGGGEYYDEEDDPGDAHVVGKLKTQWNDRPPLMRLLTLLFEVHTYGDFSEVPEQTWEKIAQSIFEIENVILNSTLTHFTNSAGEDHVKDLVYIWRRNGPGLDFYELSKETLEIVVVEEECGEVHPTFMCSVWEYLGTSSHLPLLKMLCIAFVSVMMVLSAVLVAAAFATSSLVIVQAVNIAVAAVLLFGSCLFALMSFQVFHHNALTDGIVKFIEMQSMRQVMYDGGTTPAAVGEQSPATQTEVESDPTVVPSPNGPSADRGMDHRLMIDRTNILQPHASSTGTGSGSPGLLGHPDTASVVHATGAGFPGYGSSVGSRFGFARSALMTGGAGGGGGMGGGGFVQFDARSRMGDTMTSERAGAIGFGLQSQINPSVMGMSIAPSQAGGGGSINPGGGEEFMQAYVLCDDSEARAEVCDRLWDHRFLVVVFPELTDLLSSFRQTRSMSGVKLFIVYADMLSLQDYQALKVIEETQCVVYVGKDLEGGCVVPRHLVQTLPLTTADIDRMMAPVLQAARAANEINVLRNGKRFRVPHYTLGRRLGGGAFGNVFEAELDALGGRCAVKRMYVRPDEGTSKLRDIAREVDIMSRLQHPYIVQYLFCKREGNCICIFMEMCEGGSLNGLITRRELNPDTAKAYLRQIIEAVQYLHSRQITHRDLKPENVLFRGGQVKLSDFGTAASFKRGGDFRNVKGTFNFMAPEVLLSEPYGKLCDIWSIGCIAADMLNVTLDHRLMGLQPMTNFYRTMEMDGGLKVSVQDPVVKDFLESCFRRDPQLRPSPQRLLDHPLLKADDPSMRRHWESIPKMAPVGHRNSIGGMSLKSIAGLMRGGEDDF